jgi:hypothetical protein
VKCKHKHTADRYFWVQTVPGSPTSGRYMMRRWCTDCENWLSLGPANDEPEAVKIELRGAAKFACAMTSGETKRCDCSVGRLEDKAEDQSEEVYRALWGFND